MSIRSAFQRMAVVLGLLLAVTPCAPGWAEELPQARDIRIGVLANRGHAYALKEWTAHGAYLNARLHPLRFSIVPLSFSELTGAVQRREVDLVITNSGHYTELELSGNISRIATRLMASPDGPLDQFGGVAIARIDRAGLNRYTDLRGLRVMIPDKSSLGGWQVHLREALEQGLDLAKGVNLITTGNHEKVVEGVLSGAADAGLVRTDLIESMAREGRLNPARLHIINQRHTPGFPYQISTRLYPEWPLARVTGVPDRLAKDVLVALLAMQPDDPAAKAAGIHGWTLPQNYQRINDLFREARLGPYAQLPITATDLLALYGRVLAAIVLVVILLLAGMIWYVSSVNVSLKREIRRRIEAEHSLEESDSRFRDMANTLPSLIWLAGPDKRCTFFNRAWLTFTGRTLEQEMGDGWTIGVHPDDLQACLQTYTDSFDARLPFEMKYRLRHASGEYRWIVDSGTPRYGPEGEFRGYFGHCLDITEMQRLTEALEEGRERYAVAQRAARIASLDWNVETNLPQWSDEIDAMLGYPAGGFPRTLEAFLDRVHPEDRAAVQHAMQAAVRQERIYAIEHRILLPDGGVRWLAEVGDVVRDEHNRAVRMVGIVQDVTDRRQAEEALRQSNDRLTQSLDALRLHTRDLTRINEMNELLQSCLREEEIHRVFGQMAQTLALGSGGMLALSRPPGRGLQSVATWGDADGMDPLFTQDDCWGIRRGHAYEPALAGGVQCTHYQAKADLRSLCQPLNIQGETLGLLSILSPADCDEPEWLRIRQLSVTLAEALKLALSNIRLREALREQATRDPLTGLFNRRYLDETLPRELHACLREDQPLAIAILDIDHFKRYNDTWGHEAGDQVLIEVSRILREHLRASDIACRYGGEELVAVMPRAELHEARERLSRIANLVRDAEIHIHDRPLPAVTFSAGIALAPLHGDDAETLMRAADLALYAAKQAGRDRLFTVGEGG
ncbi:MAG: diguanylate cyclase [Betaproteobacteria bacterium]|nr:diguanylate cyclase [Betaproteobacteria bacterium]